MTINIFFMILTVVIGLGTSPSISTSTATADASRVRIPTDECYHNGIWYNPCPPEYATPPSGGETLELNPQ